MIFSDHGTAVRLKADTADGTRQSISKENVGSVRL
jgi:hypothetical protein